jgi:hypothetical protein
MDLSNINHGIKQRVVAKDVFYTPLPLVKTHLDYIKEYVADGDVIFDGFYGTGNYYNMFSEIFTNNTFDYTEITLGKDFFEYDKKADIICSNPPYSILQKVLEKSVALNPHTISYLIGVHNLTAKRIEYMNQNGYFLTKVKFLKVFKWFGMSAIVVFRKGGSNCIEFDRCVYK